MMLAIVMLVPRPSPAAEMATSKGSLMSAGPVTGPVVLDGRLDEPAWSLAVTASELSVLGTRSPAPRPTTFKFLYTADALLVGVECQTLMGGRKVMAKPAIKEHDGPVFSDESIELYLQPASSSAYYHFAVNSAAAQYEGKGMDNGWNGEWTARTSESELGWQLEISIPYKTLGVDTPPKPGDVWRFNVCRNDRTHQKYETWAEVVGGFHDPQHFGPLQFLDSAVGVGARQLTRRGKDLAVQLAARSGAQAQTVKAQFTLQTPAGRFDREASVTPSPNSSAIAAATAEQAWISETTVYVAHSVQSGDTILYRSPSLTYPAEMAKSERPQTPTPVRIENDAVALSFDQDAGNLLTAENKQSGMVVKFGELGTPILELDAVRYLQNPRFFRPEDVQTLTAGYDTFIRLNKRKDAEGETLDIEHRLEADLSVKLSITVPKEGVETQWRITLDNPLTYEPSKALVVHRLRYPCFTDVPEDACGGNPFVILPTLMGQKVPEPAKHLVGASPISYIGAATMGWFDFYGANGGLYFKVGDIEPLPQTGLLARSDPNTHRLTLAIERWPLAWMGDKWTPGPVGLAVHAGDWHKAADLYRAWFRKTFKLYDPPQWLKDADGYVMSGGATYEFADFPRAIENAKAIGLNYIQLWCEMTGGDISYHAFFFPNPYMGTEEDLKKAIADMHKRGGHIGFYLNFITGDPLMGTFTRQPMNEQKFPKDIPRPAPNYMEDNWIQQSIMSPAGSYSTWNTFVPGYLDGYWNQCPAAKKWTDYYYYWVIEKWAKQYGADVWYLDSCPVSLGYPCYAFDHGHDKPAPEGQNIINFYKRLRARAPKGFCIMQEYSSDRLLQWSTHALGLPWHPAFPHPEVVRYTLPEYPLFSGMCNGWERVSQFYPGEKVEFRDALERVFLIGNRYEFGFSNRPPDMVSQWEKKMVDLRRACRPEMNYGDFLDEIGLGPLPEGVYARLFRRSDKGRLAVTLLDRRKENRTPFNVTIDLGAASVGSPKRVQLVTFDGEQTLPTPRIQGDRMEITVPVFPERTAALLIEVEKPNGR